MSHLWWCQRGTEISKNASNNPAGEVPLFQGSPMPNAPSGAGLAAASRFQQYLRSRHSFAPNNSHRLSCGPGSCSAPYSRITIASASWALRNAEVREATNVLYRAGGYTSAASAQVRTWHRADNFYAATTLSVVGGYCRPAQQGPQLPTTAEVAARPHWLLGFLNQIRVLATHLWPSVCANAPLRAK